MIFQTLRRYATGAAAGERLTWGGAENDAVHGANKVAKKKIWEKVQPELKTTDARVVTFGGVELTTTAGPVTTPTVSGGTVG